MDKKKKLIMWAIFVISFAQTPQSAISPAINQIKTTAFPGYELSFIQMILVLSSLVSPFFFIISAELIRRGIVARRTAISFGMATFGLVGILSFFLNSQLWHVMLMAVLVGIGVGCCIANNTSVILDYFNMEERQRITGIQTVFINAGGAVFSFVGGLLASIVWHGAYKVMLLCIPIAVFAYIALPGGKRPRIKKTSSAEKVKSKMNKRIYFYAAAIFLFMFIFSVFGGNISTHLSQSGFADPKFAGTATAIQMAGGGVFGVIFSKLSKKFNDYLIPIGFTMICVSYTAMNIFHFSLYLIYFGAFLLGCAFSMIAPQCIVGASGCVDASTSSTGSAIVSGFVPSIGGFLSPLIITNLTRHIGGDSTRFRYQAVGLFALTVACVMAAFVFKRTRGGMEAKTVSIS